MKTTGKSKKESPKPAPAQKKVKTDSVKAASSSQGAASFPKKELDKWLKNRSSWDHDDWSKLLQELKQKGYEHLVASSEGQESLGNYLETNRR